MLIISDVGCRIGESQRSSIILRKIYHYYNNAEPGGKASQKPPFSFLRCFCSIDDSLSLRQFVFLRPAQHIFLGAELSFSLENPRRHGKQKYYHGCFLKYISKSVLLPLGCKQLPAQKQVNNKIIFSYFILFPHFLGRLSKKFFFL